ncbi:amino acid adenylation domain-containing protein [Nocardia sp. NPDC058058]|uniref:non-ribosomal peptide synthetase n=1 Tax=Nocardia sp. NPDC058058 TaxID=3346317 RepID=UPI0036D9076A
MPAQSPDVRVAVPFELSRAQMELWLADDLGTGDRTDPRALPGQAHYLELRGELDAELFDAASRRAFEEFGVGRLRIGRADGRPYQWLAADIGGGLERVDLTSEAEPYRAALDWMQRRHREPIELIDAPLWAAALLRVEPELHIWYAQMHHVAIDGYGGLSLIARIGQWYDALLRETEPEPFGGLAPESIQVSDAEYRASARFTADRDYWRERFSDWTVAPPSGVAARVRGTGPVPVALRSAGALSPFEWVALEQLAAECAVSPAQVLVAAVCAFRAGTTGGTEPMVQLAASARTTAALKRSGGMLANVLPIRLRCAGAITARELIAAAAREITGGLRHQRYRFEELRRDLGVSPDQMLGPTVNLMFFDRTSRFGRATGEYRILSSGSVADLHFNLYRAGAEEGLSVDILANPDRYDQPELNDLLNRFLLFLGNFLAADPDQPVGGIGLLTDSERDRILHAPNRIDGPEPRLLPDLLTAGARRGADTPAVLDGATSLGYARLDHLSNQLAHNLIRRGIGPEDIVAVPARRSADWVVAIWALAKAGAAYLPIDPTQPADRLASILAEAGVRLLLDTAATPFPARLRRGRESLTVPALSESAADPADMNAAAGVEPRSRGAVPVEGGRAVAAGAPDGAAGNGQSAISGADRVRALRPGHPAYVIYTSGSTGAPKGVVVTHAGLAGLLAAQADHLPAGPGDRVLCATTPTFDASLWEVLLAATTGATLVIADGDSYAGPRLADLIRRERVTHAFLTPAVLAATDPTGLPTLHYLSTGGEACPPAVVAAWSPGRTLVNVYGPTEASIVTNLASLTPDRPVTLGTPVPGMRCYVLDPWLRPVPPGVVGELYLGGPGLARGFLTRQAATATSFLADPFGAPGERLYRTGDLATRTDSGDLEFHGRLDSQIKIRGIRIELGEIEAAVAACPGVAQAVVVVHPGGGDGGEFVRPNEAGVAANPSRRSRAVPAGASVIAAYAVPEPGVLLTTRELEVSVAQRLPSYMVPVIVLLDRLPVTANGKVDRAALPAPVAAASRFRYRAPVTAAEKVVAQVFAEVLGGTTGVSAAARAAATANAPGAGAASTAAEVAAAGTRMATSGAETAAAGAENATSGTGVTVPGAAQRIAFGTNGGERLGGRRIGLDDDFFALGGDSLGAALVAGRVGAALGVAAGVRDLFEAGTVAGFAARVGARDLLVERERPGVRERGPVVPMSYAQQRLWLAQRMDPESAAYNMLLGLRLTGALDVSALTAALTDVVERHEALRTSFPEVDGVVRQRIAPVDTVVSGLVAETVAAQDVEQTLAEFGRASFDLAAAPPILVRLLRIHDPKGVAEQHILAVLVHHVIADGLSLAPFARDLAAAYPARARSAAPQWTALPVQYADYTLWQREVLGAANDPESELSRQLGYWSRALAGLPVESGLPPHRPRPARGSRRAGRVSVEVPGSTVRGLREVARRHGATMFMVVHAGLSAVLAAVSGGSDIAVGTPVAGRGDARLDDLIGMFVNTLVLRVPVDPAESCDGLLSRVRDIDLSAFAHDDAPFEQVVDALELPRSGTRHPLFQVMLSFRPRAHAEFELPGLRVESVEMPLPLAKFDLEFTVAESPDELAVSLRYAAELFDEPAMSALTQRLCRMLEHIARDAAAPVGALDLCSAEERRLLREWNETGQAVAITLPGLLTRAAAYDPDACAMRCESGALSYRELGQRANQLARRLIALGIGPEDIVAVALPRSPEWVVAVCAIAHSGAAYLPVDPNAPAERIEHMLADSGAALGITTDRRRADLPALAGGGWLLIDPDEPADDPAAPVTDADRVRPLRPHHPAYVMYTSGSTGIPKAATITHGGLANVLVTQAQRCDADPDARVLAVASPSFDASVWELLLALGSGATLVLAPPWAYAGDALLDLLEQERITHAMLTPRVLATLADPGRLPHLRLLATAGETCPPELAALWSAGRCFVNVYGPTETTIWSSVSRPLCADATVSIGGPVVGARCHVLDGRLREVPPGVIGEIYVSGPGLARGYHRRPGFTSTRFVPSPFAETGERLYRTGDLGCWRGDGELDYHGRNDFQIKIRGVRVELGEIEAALTTATGVADAVVVLHADARPEPRSAAADGPGAVSTDAADLPPADGAVRSGPGEPEIVAYVVPEAGHRIDPAELRVELARILPERYLPTVTVLERFPLTITGKVDRAALPAPERARERYRAPETPLEEAVARAFASVLGRDRVGADGDFFTLGGNSLSATRAVAALRTAGIDLELRALFEEPTVAGLAGMLAARGARAPFDPIGDDARPRPDRVPLSFAQQGIWLLDRLGAGAAYHIPLAVRLSGALDVAALTAAVADVTRRHEALRTYFPESDGTPYQAVAQSDRGTLEIRRVTRQRLDQVLAEFECEPFDLAAAPPMRARLYGIDEVGRPASWVLILVVHHVNADGFSLGPLARDLATAYTARALGGAPKWPVLPMQYSDYAIRQHAALGTAEDPGSELNRQLKQWISVLDGAPLELPLPFDRPRPRQSRHTGGSVEWTVPPEITGGLRELGRRHRASLFMVVHAVLTVLLAKHSGTADIVIGTPTAGRDQPGLDDLVGMFVNPVALRVSVDERESFARLLHRVRDLDVEALDNAHTPFERIVEALDLPRSTARHPLFQVVLAYQSFGSTELSLPGVRVETLPPRTGSVRFDLEFEVAERNSGLDLTLRYDSGLFDPDTAESLLRRFGRLLAQVSVDPDRPVQAMDVLTPEERHDILYGWNRTGGATCINLPGLMCRAVALAPDATAVVYGDRSLTYRELDEQSNRLTRALIRRGIGTGDVVAVAVRRSVDWVITLWAVAKSGATYLPIDPRHPSGRIEQVLTDSAAALGITTSGARPWLPDLGAVRGARSKAHATTDSIGAQPMWLTLDAPEVSAELAATSAAVVTGNERLRNVRLHDAAYLIFTSGSTGAPKGVVITHAGLANTVAAQSEHCAPQRDSRILAAASQSFDASIWELLLALGAAATLVLADPDLYGGPELTDLIRRERITHAFLTPAVLAELDPDELRSTATDSVDDASESRSWAGSEPRVLVTGGEAVPPALAARWSDGRRLLIAYGPTEVTVISNYSAPYERGQSVTLGGPAVGMRCYVLDAGLRPVPDGVTGELYIAGAGVARGYHGRKGLTALRFLPDPFAPGRMYRTGDAVRRRADGALEFLGRNDSQVKVRGMRVEPGEIEAALTDLPGVGQAVAVLHAERPGDARIVAYITADAPNLEVAGVRAALTATLPAHLVPSAIVLCERLPRTVNGKLDRAALPAPAPETAEFRAPATTVERAVAGVFGEVLHLDRVGLDDDFFRLGGNSLSATRVAARLSSALGARVPVRAIFDAPTVAALAAHLAAAPRSTRTPLTAQPRPDHIPLSYAQQRLWLLHRLDPQSDAYHIPLVLRLRGRLNVTAMQTAVREVIARHESLRTYYPDLDGQGVQRILPEPRGRGEGRSSDSGELVNVAGSPPRILETRVVDGAAVRAELREFCSRPFDLTAAVPVRGGLFALGESLDSAREWVLAFVIHHANADGYSLGPLARDLAAAYSAACQGIRAQWAELPVQYADYTLWQRAALGTVAEPDSEMSRQIDYWATTLAGSPAELGLPVDRPRPVVASCAGAAMACEIPDRTVRGLRAVAAEHDASLFMVLHASLAVLLAAWSDGDDIAIGTPVAGRGAAELDDLVGMFVNTLVLRTEVRAAQSFSEFLERVRGVDLAAFAHAEVPFEQVVEAVDPPRSRSRHPLFQVMLALQNLEPARLELPGLSAEVVAPESSTARFDLEFTVAPTDSGLTVTIRYATELFDHDTIVALAGRYLSLLDHVAAEPLTPIARLPILGTSEHRRIIQDWNRTGAADSDLLLPGILAAAVRRAADVEAVRYGDLALTYRELDDRADRLAGRLIARGVGPEDVVALGMSRSLAWVVACWAVAKSGAAFMPVDPAAPAARTTDLLHSVRPRVIITTATESLALGNTEMHMIALSADGTVATDSLPEIDRAPDAGAAAVRSHAERPRPAHIGNAAYIIHTSGSTGVPKGVVISHAGLANLAATQVNSIGVEVGDRVLCVAAPSFDASVWELVLAAGAAAALVVAPPEVYAGAALAEFLRRERVTHAFITPAVLACTDAAGLTDLRAVISGGEACPPGVAAVWGRAHRLVNVYGPTEATVIATLEDALDGERPVTIGGPVVGARCYVLDRCLRPVPVGATGELYLGGAGLARGYSHRTAATAAHFVADPFGPAGARLYRTGDRAAWTADGQLIYKGRGDFQVKLRGMRLELGEIEAAIAAAPGVAQVVAALVHPPAPAAADTRTGADTREVAAEVADPAAAAAGARLVAYVIAEPGRTIDVAAVTEVAAQRLPAQLMPTVVPLERMPMLANGKVDRAALPAPALPAVGFRAPVTPEQQRVATAFAELLGVAVVGLDDDFFTLGGNSLTAARAIALLDGAVTLRDLFEAPQVEALARRLEPKAPQPTAIPADSAEIASGAVENESYAVVLPLRRTGPDTLFCIHPGGGMAWPYAGLLTHLDPAVSLYGIQDPWVVRDEPAFATLADYADRYVAEIRRVQPVGPYRLLGWSLGGRIAHEVAVRLQLLGARVRTLALLDTAAYDGTEQPSGDTESAWAELRANGDVARAAAVFPPDLVERATVALSRAVPGEPSGRYRGDLLHFTAIRETDAARRPAESWIDHITGVVTDIEVDATHIGMSAAAPLAVIGRELARRWDRP